jgi:hypothetical protein
MAYMLPYVVRTENSGVFGSIKVVIIFRTENLKDGAEDMGVVSSSRAKS